MTTTLTPTTKISVETSAGVWTIETNEAGALIIGTPTARQIEWKDVKVIGNWKGVIVPLKGMK